MKLNSMWAICAIGILIFVLSSISSAQSKPINIALFNPVQVFPEDNSIEGLRIIFIYGTTDQ